MKFCINNCSCKSTDATLLTATQTSIDRDVKIDHFQLLCIAVSDGQNAESALWWVFHLSSRII